MTPSPLTTGSLVRLTKLSAERTPPGALPTPYWLEGMLARTPAVGDTIEVARSVRAGRAPGEPAVVRCPGIFESTPVREIMQGEGGVLIAITQNSHWQITPITSVAGEKVAQSGAGPQIDA